MIIIDIKLYLDIDDKLFFCPICRMAFTKPRAECDYGTVTGIVVSFTRCPNCSGRVYAAN